MLRQFWTTRVDCSAVVSLLCARATHAKYRYAAIASTKSSRCTSGSGSCFRPLVNATEDAGVSVASSEDAPTQCTMPTDSDVQLETL